MPRTILRAITRPPPPTLEDRIADLHSEIEALVEKAVDREVAQAPGVPRDVLRGHLIRDLCHCQAARKILSEQN